MVLWVYTSSKALHCPLLKICPSFSVSNLHFLAIGVSVR